MRKPLVIATVGLLGLVALLALPVPATGGC